MTMNTKLNKIQAGASNSSEKDFDNMQCALFVNNITGITLRSLADIAEEIKDGISDTLVSTIYIKIQNYPNYIQVTNSYKSEMSRGFKEVEDALSIICRDDKNSIMKLDVNYKDTDKAQPIAEPLVTYLGVGNKPLRIKIIKTYISLRLAFLYKYNLVGEALDLVPSYVDDRRIIAAKTAKRYYGALTESDISNWIEKYNKFNDTYPDMWLIPALKNRLKNVRDVMIELLSLALKECCSGECNLVDGFKLTDTDSQILDSIMRINKPSSEKIAEFMRILDSNKGAKKDKVKMAFQQWLQIKHPGSYEKYLDDKTRKFYDIINGIKVRYENAIKAGASTVDDNQIEKDKKELDEMFLLGDEKLDLTKEQKGEIRNQINSVQSKISDYVKILLTKEISDISSLYTLNKVKDCLLIIGDERISRDTNYLKNISYNKKFGWLINKKQREDVVAQSNEARLSIEQYSADLLQFKQQMETFAKMKYKLDLYAKYRYSNDLHSNGENQEIERQLIALGSEAKVKDEYRKAAELYTFLSKKIFNTSQLNQSLRAVFPSSFSLDSFLGLNNLMGGANSKAVAGSTCGYYGFERHRLAILEHINCRDFTRDLDAIINPGKLVAEVKSAGKGNTEEENNIQAYVNKLTSLIASVSKVDKCYEYMNEFVYLYPKKLEVEDEKITSVREKCELHIQNKSVYTKEIDAEITRNMEGLSALITKKIEDFVVRNKLINENILQISKSIDDKSGKELIKYLLGLKKEIQENEAARLKCEEEVKVFKVEVINIPKGMLIKDKVSVVEQNIQKELNLQVEQKDFLERQKKTVNQQIVKILGEKITQIYSDLQSIKVDIDELKKISKLTLEKYLYKKDDFAAIKATLEKILESKITEFNSLKQSIDELVGLDAGKTNPQKSKKSAELDVGIGLYASSQQKLSDLLKAIIDCQSALKDGDLAIKQKTKEAEKRQVDYVVAECEIKVNPVILNPATLQYIKICEKVPSNLLVANKDCEYVVIKGKNEIHCRQANETEFKLFASDDRITEATNQEYKELDKLVLLTKNFEKMQSMIRSLLEAKFDDLAKKTTDSESILNEIKINGIGGVSTPLWFDKFEKEIAAIIKDKYKAEIELAELIKTIQSEVIRVVEENKKKSPPELDDLLSRLGVDLEQRRVTDQQRHDHYHNMIKIITEGASEAQETQLDADKLMCLEVYKKTGTALANTLTTNPIVMSSFQLGVVKAADVEQKAKQFVSSSAVIRALDDEKKDITYTIGKNVIIDGANCDPKKIDFSKCIKITFSGQVLSTAQIQQLLFRLAELDVNFREIDIALGSQEIPKDLQESITRIIARNKLVKALGTQIDTGLGHEAIWQEFWKQNLSTRLAKETLSLYDDCKYNDEFKKVADAQLVANSLIVATGVDYFKQLLKLSATKAYVCKELQINYPSFDLKDLALNKLKTAKEAYIEARNNLQAAYLNSLNDHIEELNKKNPKLAGGKFPFSVIKLELNPEFLGDASNLLALQKLLKTIARQGDAITELKINIVDLSNGTSKQFKDLEDNQYKALQETLEDDSECRFDITINAGEPPSTKKKSLTNAIEANRRKFKEVIAGELALQVDGIAKEEQKAQVVKQALEEKQKQEQEKQKQKQAQERKDQEVKDLQRTEERPGKVGRPAPDGPSPFKKKDYKGKVAIQVQVQAQAQAKLNATANAAINADINANVNAQQQAKMNAQREVKMSGEIKTAIFSYSEFTAPTSDAPSRINTHLSIDKNKRNDIGPEEVSAQDLWKRIISPSCGKIEGSIMYVDQIALTQIEADPRLYMSGFDQNNLPPGFAIKMYTGKENGKLDGLCLCYNSELNEKEKGKSAQPDEVIITPKPIADPKAMHGDDRQLTAKPSTRMFDHEDGQYRILAIKLHTDNFSELGLLNEDCYPVLVQNTKEEEFYIEKANATPLLVTNTKFGQYLQYSQDLQCLTLNSTHKQNLETIVKAADPKLTALRESAFTFGGLILGSKVFAGGTLVLDNQTVALPIPKEYDDWSQTKWFELLIKYMQQDGVNAGNLYTAIIQGEEWTRFIGLPVSRTGAADPAFIRKIIALLGALQYSGLKGMDLLFKRLDILYKKDPDLYKNFKESFIQGRLSLNSFIDGDDSKALDEILALKEPKLGWWKNLSKNHTNKDYGFPVQELSSLYEQFKFFVSLFSTEPGDLTKPALPPYPLPPKGLDTNTNMLHAMNHLHAIISSAGENATEQLKHLDGLDLSTEGAFHAAIKYKYHFFTKEMDLKPGTSEQSYAIDYKKLQSSSGRDFATQTVLFYRFLGKCEPKEIHKCEFNKYIKLVEDLELYKSACIDDGIKKQLLTIFSQTTTGRGNDHEIDFSLVSGILDNFKEIDKEKLGAILTYIISKLEFFWKVKPTLGEVSSLIYLLKELKDVKSLDSNFDLKELLHENIQEKTWLAIVQWKENIPYHISANNLLIFAKNVDANQVSTLTKIAALAVSKNATKEQDDIVKLQEQLKLLKTKAGENYQEAIKVLSYIKSNATDHKSAATLEQLTKLVSNCIARGAYDKDSICKEIKELGLGFNEVGFIHDKSAEKKNVQLGDETEEEKLTRINIARQIEAIEARCADLIKLCNDSDDSKVKYSDPRDKIPYHGKENKAVLDNLLSIYKNFDELYKKWKYDDFSIKIFKDSPFFKVNSVQDLNRIFDAFVKMENEDKTEVFYPEVLFDAIFSKDNYRVNKDICLEIEKIITGENFVAESIIKLTTDQKADLIRIAKIDLTYKDKVQKSLINCKESGELPSILDRALKLFTSNFTGGCDLHSMVSTPTDKQVKLNPDITTQTENLLLLVNPSKDSKIIKNAIFDRLLENVEYYNKLLSILETVKGDNNKKLFLKIIAISYLGDDCDAESIKDTFDTDIIQKLANLDSDMFGKLGELYEKRPYPKKARLNAFLKMDVEDIAKGRLVSQDVFIRDFKQDPHGHRYVYDKSENKIPANAMSRAKMPLYYSGGSKVASNEITALDNQFPIDDRMNMFIDKIEDLFRNDTKERKLFQGDREYLKKYLVYIYSVGCRQDLSVPGLSIDASKKSEYRKPVKDLTSDQLEFLFKHYQDFIARKEENPADKLCAELELEAVLNEIYYRNTGLMPAPEQTIAIISNTILYRGETILNRMPTGAGKSLVIARVAASMYLRGQKMVNCTCNQDLVVREIKNQSAFFEALGTKFINIDANTTYEEFLASAGGSSTLALFSLFTQKQELLKGNDMPKTTLAVDEGDNSLYDDTTDYRLAKGNDSDDPYHNKLEWIYKIILDYVREGNFYDNFRDGPNARQEEAKSLRVYIINALMAQDQKDKAKIVREGKNGIDDYQLSSWIDAACHVLTFKEKTNYSSTIETVKIGNENRRTRKALVVNDSKIMYGCMFSDGRQQMLCALLNESKEVKDSGIKYIIPPESGCISVAGPKGILNYYAGKGFDITIANKQPEITDKNLEEDTYVVFDNKLYYIDATLENLKREINDDSQEITHHKQPRITELTLKDRVVFEKDKKNNEKYTEKYTDYAAYEQGFLDLLTNFKTKAKGTEGDKKAKLSKYAREEIDKFTGHVQNKRALLLYTGTPGEGEELQKAFDQYHAIGLGFAAAQKSKLINKGHSVNFTDASKTKFEKEYLACYLKAHESDEDKGVDFKNFMNSERLAQFAAIYNNAIKASRNGQPSLIICPDDTPRPNFSKYLNEYFRARFAKEIPPIPENDQRLQYFTNEKYSTDADKADFIKKARSSGGEANQHKCGTISIADPSYARGIDIQPDSKAIEAGGLNLIATYIMLARTLVQTVGRAARQGDPGSAEIILSEKELEDIVNDLSETDQKKLRLTQAEKSKLITIYSNPALMGDPNRKKTEPENKIAEIIAIKQKKLEAELSSERLKHDYQNDFSKQFNYFWRESRRNIIRELNRITDNRLNYRTIRDEIEESNNISYSRFTKSVDDAWKLLLEEDEVNIKDSGAADERTRERLKLCLEKLKKLADEGWERTKKEIFASANEIAKKHINAIKDDSLSHKNKPKVEFNDQRKDQGQDQVNLEAITNPKLQYLQAYYDNSDEDAKYKDELTFINEFAVLAELGSHAFDLNPNLQQKILKVEIRKINHRLASSDRIVISGAIFKDQDEIKDIFDEESGAVIKASAQEGALAKKAAEAELDSDKSDNKSDSSKNDADNVGKLLENLLKAYRTEVGKSLNSGIYATKLLCLRGSLTEQVARYGAYNGQIAIKYCEAHRDIFYPKSELDEKIVAEAGNITKQLLQGEDIADFTDFKQIIEKYLALSAKELAAIKLQWDGAKKHQQLDKDLIDALDKALKDREIDVNEQVEFLKQFHKATKQTKLYKESVKIAKQANEEFFKTIKTQKLIALNDYRLKLTEKHKELQINLEEVQKNIKRLKDGIGIFKDKTGYLEQYNKEIKELEDFIAKINAEIKLEDDTLDNEIILRGQEDANARQDVNDKIQEIDYNEKEFALATQVCEESGRNQEDLKNFMANMFRHSNYLSGKITELSKIGPPKYKGMAVLIEKQLKELAEQHQVTIENIKNSRLPALKQELEQRVKRDKNTENEIGQVGTEATRLRDKINDVFGSRKPELNLIALNGLLKQAEDLNQSLLQISEPLKGAMGLDRGLRQDLKDRLDKYFDESNGLTAFEIKYKENLSLLQKAIRERQTKDEQVSSELQNVIEQLKKIYENELNHLTVADGIPASSENKDTKEAFDKLSVVELNKIMDKLLDNTKGGILANLEEQNKVITSIIKNKQGFDMQIIQLINDGIRKYNDVVEKITERKGMLERRMSFIVL